MAKRMQHLIICGSAAGDNASKSAVGGVVCTIAAVVAIAAAAAAISDGR